MGFVHRFGNISVSGTPTDGQVPIWTDADTIEGSVFGEIWIAATDGTTGEKAKALASGGTVCNQTDDQVNLAAVISA